MLMPSDSVAQRDIILELFRKVKKDFTMMASFWCDYGYDNKLFFRFQSAIASGASAKFTINDDENLRRFLL